MAADSFSKTSLDGWLTATDRLAPKTRGSSPALRGLVKLLAEIAVEHFLKENATSDEPPVDAGSTESESA